MLDIEKVDHIGIRICEKERSVAFYNRLGFKVISDTGFGSGKPIIMRHPSSVTVNLLGPAIKNGNILMDIDKKYSGFTHMALKVGSVLESEKYFDHESIQITGRFTFEGMKAIFVRDPDGNVIEFDEYIGEVVTTRV